MNPERWENVFLFLICRQMQKDMGYFTGCRRAGNTMRKKNEYVFNIGFNKSNPEHIETVKILNRMGHGKAGYLAKAVIFYEQHRENVFNDSTPINIHKLEEIVRSIISREEKNIA